MHCEYSQVIPLPARIPVALLCAAFLLAGCGPGGPPPGYEPARTSAKDISRACPDLTGSYQPDRTQWMDEFLTQKRPAVAGALSARIANGATFASLTWHGDRDAFLAHARSFALTQPLAYPAWRKLVLRQDLSQQLARDEDAYQEAVNRLGPSWGRSVPLPGRQCADNWMLLGYRNVLNHMESDKRGKPVHQEVELWLSRSAAGELLLRRVTHDLFHYTLWAASQSSLRTGSRSEFDKWPAAVTRMNGVLRAEDMPAPFKPPSRETCRFTSERLAELARRLKPTLPDGVLLEQLTHGLMHGLPGDDGRCTSTPLALTFSVTDIASLPAITAALRADGALSSVEVPRPVPGKMQKFSVRLLARPD